MKPREIKKITVAIDRLSGVQRGIACLNLTEFASEARRIESFYKRLEDELFAVLGPTPKGVTRWFVGL